jgi:hypothetical protein
MAAPSSPIGKTGLGESGTIAGNTPGEDARRWAMQQDLAVRQQRNPGMKRFFTLEYWQDDGWFVGRLREVPGVFSQGQTLDELKENIADAYRMMQHARR